MTHATPSVVTPSKATLIHAGKRTVDMELRAIEKLLDRIDERFVKACELMLACCGRTIVTGMGKSGHIGHKIAATLASTGTPAFFVHPAEAVHGDLGMITRNDVVLMISNSGHSVEITALIPLLKRLKVPIIAMVGNASSPLAEQADVFLDISVTSEACPLDLAPTSSTSVSLVLGDALAVALLEARGFTADDFAFTHPGGALGRRLLLKTAELMRQGDNLPRVTQHCSLKEALLEMTSKGLGMTTVVDEHQSLLGVFTDGDLRRILEKNMDMNTTSIETVMSPRPQCIEDNSLAAEALGLMEAKSITALVVVNHQQKPVGVIHMHDLLKAGIL